LRSGISIDAVVDQLKGIKCTSTARQLRQTKLKVISCPDAIGKILEKAATQKATKSKIIPNMDEVRL
jgi:ribonucleoside-diphosphate reductase alpha chain